MTVQRTGQIRYGAETIVYGVLVRPQRKTLGIEVHPNGRVLVLAPSGCDDTKVAEKVTLRAGWISKQLRTFSSYDSKVSPRQYLSGESHRYLGRQHRLRVRSNDAAVAKDRVTLTRGELLVVGPSDFSTDKVKDHLRRWYLQRAREVFETVLEDAIAAFHPRGLTRPRIYVREMQSRWGSLSQEGRMTLNSRLIQAPRLCIEYVIVHELCHLVHRNHTPQFYALLTKLMPDWQKRKQRLEHLCI